MSRFLISIKGLQCIIRWSYFGEMATTRSKELFVTSVDALTRSKLTFISNTFSLTMHKLSTKMTTTTRGAATAATNEVLILWKKWRIPTTRRDHIIEKLENLYEEYKRLKRKNKNRHSGARKAWEASSKQMFSNLYDIPHVNALNIVNIQGDKAFLITQRELN